MGLKKTSIKELQSVLCQLGVKAGDVVMIHSAIFTLGIVESGLPGILKAFQNILGKDGTLIVPTFTYSFRYNEIFNVRNTPCPKVLGDFSEYIRGIDGSVRSLDPLFSMAAIGPEAMTLMRRPSINSFGKDSIYETLFSRNILILGLGITYDTGISAFIHLEKLANVEYRSERLLRGISVGMDGVLYEDSAIHYERNLEKFPRGRRNRIPFGLEMELNGISNAISYGSGKHIAIRTKLFEEYTLERLKKDPWTMFKKHSN
jgi:aminoglycoside 3-N-acetyltransferase